MNYVIYDKTGNILRTVSCPPAFADAQKRDGEFIMEGTANDITQKVVGGKVVDKTLAEIEAYNLPSPPEISENKRPAHITNELWQDVLGRLNKLETRSTKIDE